MKQKKLYKIFIWGFLFLYLLVAAISFFHAIQFFSVGNNVTMSVVLAFAFEVGLALSLAAVLLSDANKKATLPWILMIILTSVQIMGNVFSTYKYMALSETEYYQYLAQPLLFWMEGVTEGSVQIVVSWIIGAILPIIALFMTDMVASNIKNLNSLNNKESDIDSTTSESETSNSETNVFEKSQQESNSSSPINIKEPVKFDTRNFLDEESELTNKDDKSIIYSEKPTTSQINDVSADFQEPAISGAKIPAEKISPFQKIINKLKNLQTKK